MKPDRHFSDVSYALAQMDMASVDALIELIRKVRSNGGTVFTFGNGGSHSTASHFAQDLVRAVGVRAVCLGDMTPLMLAVGNDYDWEGMFANTLMGYIKQGDLAVGISCSGNSKNVLNALQVAQDHRIFTAGLTGCDPKSRIGRSGLDVLVRVPEIEEIQVQEDIHLIVCHAVVRALTESDE